MSASRFKLTPMRLIAALLIIATVAMLLPITAAANAPSNPAVTTSFNLKPFPKFIKCLAEFPNNPSAPPKAHVNVTRGTLNDTLTLTISNIKPNLNFDMFTVQHSPLLSTGAIDPGFTNFGLAWYQSDVHASSTGTGSVTIRTILLDQIFGFDAGTGLAPTNTLHVGFWFNNPQNAAPCGFVGTTPFNGEHNAGPVAMISVPNAVTGLGPLCTKPNTSTSPPTCNP